MVQAARSGRQNIVEDRMASATSEAAADTLLCLSNQAIFLRKRQIENQEQEFVEEGGFTEKLYWVKGKSEKSEG
jgi:four helix bundle suffix protein